MTTRFKGVPNLPFAPFVAVLFGVVASVLISQTPNWMLENLVSGLGIASVIPAAAPPLGDTARVLLSVITGLLVAVPLWLVLRIIEREIHARRMATARGSRLNTESAADAPVGEYRRRRPILAGTELGAPLMSDEALSNGGELLLSDSLPSAEDRAAMLDVAPSRPLQEETLLDLTSWNHAPAEEAPLELSVPFETPVTSVETPHTLPPISWDEPLTVEAPVEAAVAETAAEPVINWDSIAPESVAEAPIDVADPFETLSGYDVPVTFETVPLESLLNAPDVPKHAAPAEAADVEAPVEASVPAPTIEERPRDILDSVSFLTPHDFGDDFVENPMEMERMLSARGFQNVPPEVAPEAPLAEVPVSQAPVSQAPVSQAPVPQAPIADGDDDESLIDLIDRLEAALARRSASSAQPIPAPANLAALRDMLHQGQRAANW